MPGWIVVVILIVLLIVGYRAWEKRRWPDSSVSEPPPTEAELLQARLDLLRIERGVDVALAKQDARREAQRTKDAIAEALEDGR